MRLSLIFLLQIIVLQILERSEKSLALISILKYQRLSKVRNVAISDKLIKNDLDYRGLRTFTSSFLLSENRDVVELLIFFFSSTSVSIDQMYNCVYFFT